MKNCILWSNSISKFFNIKSACPQDNILGPKLFNLVIDKLLVNLERFHLGCFVGNCFAGVFAYANDIILLLSSPRQLHPVNVRFMH